MKSLFTLLCLGLLTSCNQDNPIANPDVHAHGDDFEIEFTVTLENHSDDTALTTPMSPGFWAVATQDVEHVLFQANQKASAGLESLAEDGAPAKLDEETEAKTGYTAHKTTDAIPPGGKIEFKFTAKPGAKLSFATMLVESNDLFFSTAEGGIILFDKDNEPIKGDMSSKVSLWDAGTEKNQEPGKGEQQPPRQAEKNTGDAEDGTVKLISEVDDGFSYPEAGTMLKISIANNDVHDHDHEGEAHEGDDHDHEAEQ